MKSMAPVSFEKGAKWEGGGERKKSLGGSEGFEVSSSAQLGKEVCK